MDWTTLLKNEVEEAYRAASGLMKLVDPDKLDWKPATGQNWMTTGQLLKHMVGACGACCKGIATGNWGIPEGDASEEAMLPPAEKLPAVSSLGEAIEGLEEDRRLALQMIEETGERDLATKELELPWGSRGVMGKHMLDMVGHLNSHKAQLFAYLKLQGKPVNTHHLYGMEG
jgi:hypothetical protein